VNTLTEVVQQMDTATLSPLDTDDDELIGVFAEMAADRQNRVVARAQLAQTVQEDWTKAQEEVRANEQMRQTNMSNMWRSTFNPFGGGGMMPMPMTPMAPMTPQPGMMPQVGMNVSMPGQPGMMQPGMMQPGMMQPGMMQPGMPGAYPPGPGMAGSFSSYPGAPGVPGPYPSTTYPAPPGVSSAMAGAPPYYYR
jgi:hypothetical protein